MNIFHTFYSSTLPVSWKDVNLVGEKMKYFSLEVESDHNAAPVYPVLT